MPRLVRCADGPTPDSIRSCGELTVPPQRMTSRSAQTVSRTPCRMISTPFTRPFSMTIRTAIASDRRSRLPRRRPACAKATAALARRPLPMLVSMRPKPSTTSVLRSSTTGYPDSPAAARKASQIGRSSRDRLTTIGPSSPCHSPAPRLLVSAFLKYGSTSSNDHPWQPRCAHWSYSSEWPRR